MSYLYESVQSSNLAKIGYDVPLQQLEVHFKGGGVYTYYGVPESLYEEFVVAESKGRFFHQNIRNNFKFAGQKK